MVAAGVGFFADIALRVVFGVNDAVDLCPLAFVAAGGNDGHFGVRFFVSGEGFGVRGNGFGGFGSSEW